MSIQVFAHDGEAGFDGVWSTITSARGFDINLWKIPKQATHWVRYTTGSMATLAVGELLTGGSSTKTCRLVAKILEQGAFGTTNEEGILLVNALSGVFQAETLTGGTSTGTVAINQNFLPIISHTPPKAALISVEIAAINFTTSGTTPTVTSGTSFVHALTTGQSYVVRGYNNIRKFKCINSANASGAILKWTLFY